MKLEFYHLHHSDVYQPRTCSVPITSPRMMRRKRVYARGSINVISSRKKCFLISTNTTTFQLSNVRMLMLLCAIRNSTMSCCYLYKQPRSVRSIFLCQFTLVFALNNAFRAISDFDFFLLLTNFFSIILFHIFLGLNLVFLLY